MSGSFSAMARANGARTGHSPSRFVSLRQAHGAVPEQPPARGPRADPAVELDDAVERPRRGVRPDVVDVDGERSGVEPLERARERLRRRGARRPCRT